MSETEDTTAVDVLGVAVNALREIRDATGASDVGHDTAHAALDIIDGRLAGDYEWTLASRAAGTAQQPITVEPKRYALVEQMGFRRTYGVIRETEFAGKPMAELTPLDGTSVRLVAPESLYQVTWLTREQAERATRTGAHAVAALTSATDNDPWQGSVDIGSAEDGDYDHCEPTL